MAVVLMATVKNFVGLSTDSKPTGVPASSTFFEYDSHELHITYDGTNWVKAR